METKMGDFILGPAVEAAVSNVIAVASDWFNLGLGWDEDLQKFQETMERLRDFLQDADEKNVSGHLRLKSWLKDLRAISDEATDILEEVAYESMRRDIPAKKPKVSYIPTRLQDWAFCREMAKKVKKLNKRLDDINHSANLLGLQLQLANMGPEARAIAGPETHSFLPSPVFGRDEDVSKIVSLLVDSSSQHDLPVITIVGMAGLGKTTLAKAVLKNDKICEHFHENKIWVCVSENFNVKKILMEMLKSIGKSSSSDGDIGSTDTVMKEIQKKLREKNYLLILDDVWNENRQMWEDLRNCLLGMSKNKGSRIRVLVTTRLEHVASLMALTNEHIHHPRQLNEDECWNIIKQTAFEDNSVPKELEGIGKQIAGRCKGVPLVASIVGATLRNRKNKEEWEAITKNHMWDSGEKENVVLNIIKFSYDRLPILALKRCFAFCSIFPKDFVMQREMLIQLWMAQGFLESSKDMAAEDIGDKYFKYLLSYSLFQEEWRCHVTGSVKSCKMHDLIHDFVQSISKSETLIVEERPRGNISHDVRHLNLIDGSEMLPTISGDVTKKLQTLFSKHGFSSGVQVDLKRLRVLSLRDASDAKQLPICFGKSKSLRYLDISRTQIEKLPEFITKLYNLQTFRFMDCRSLKMPPGGIGDLINLRHIYFSDEERMPANLGRLTNLQTLPMFFVGTTEGRKIEELGSLKGLKGRLQIHGLEFVEGRSEAERAKLHEKAVDELELRWRSTVHRRIEGNLVKLDEDVLEGLQPHSNIRRLEILGYGGRNLASWMLKSSKELLFLNDLVELIICNCKMLYKISGINGFSSLQRLQVWGCDELTSLGDGDGAVLTSMSLKQLSIYWCGKLKSFLVNGLSSLEGLGIGSCDELTCLGDGDGAVLTSMSLKQLYIDNCDKLTSLGDGALALMSLKKLSIRWCHKLESISVSGLSSLEELEIADCKMISNIGDSLSSSTCLKQLYLKCCPKLKFIPSLEGLISLKTVIVVDCDGLEYLPSGLSSCTALEELEMWTCSNLVSIPEELKQLRSLVKLVIWKCQKLKFIPSLEGLVSLKRVHVELCHGLESVLSELSSCTTLEELKICDCSNLVFNPEELKQLRSLVKLDIWKCQKLKFIPSLEGLVSLKTVDVGGCDGLECLPSGLSSCTALAELQIRRCSNLVSISEELKQLRSLVHLNINYCEKLRRFPEEILDLLVSLKTLGLGPFSEELQKFPNLSSTATSTPTSLCLEGWGKVSLPHHIQRLTALEDLTISRFNGVEEAVLGNLSCLKTLRIKDCLNMVTFQGELKELSSLTILGCPKLVGFPKESIGCCTRLKRLEIGPFSEELEEFPSLSSIHASLEQLKLWGWEKLTHLPEIQHITALKELTIRDFSGMESLPDWFNNLSSLQRLAFVNCPDKLKERCKEGSGSDWHKISHIPKIETGWKSC